MTKSELIAQLAVRHSQFSVVDIEMAVKTILDALAKNLSRGERIEIRGFGSFSLSFRPARLGRNPKSGERVQVGCSAALQGGGIARPDFPSSGFGAPAL
jgi:integration host factor subunit beta